MTDNKSLSDIINTEFKNNPAQMEAVKWLGTVFKSNDESGRSDLDFKTVLTDTDVRRCLCLDIWSEAFQTTDLTKGLIIRDMTNIFKRMRISVNGRGRTDAVNIFKGENEDVPKKSWLNNVFSGVRK
jgi:hypothetical protein